MCCLRWFAWFFSAGKCIPAGHTFCSARFQAFNSFVCLSCIVQFACAMAFVNFLLFCFISTYWIYLLCDFGCSVIQTLTGKRRGSLPLPAHCFGPLVLFIPAAVMSVLQASRGQGTQPGELVHVSKLRHGDAHRLWEDIIYWQLTGVESSLCRLLSLSTEHL